MADISARFRLIDEMSDRLGRMAESGQNMASQWEQAGAAANSAFSGMNSAVATASSSVDGVATSINSVQGAASNAAASADELAESVNAYEDAAGAAAEASEELSDAAEEAAEDAEQSSERGSQAAEQLAAALTAAGITTIVKEMAEAFMDAAQAAAQVETAYAKLQTIAGSDSMGMLSGQILDLSSETGILQDSLADVTYNAISAGAAVGDAVGTAEAASKLAAAGFTETSSALSVLSTAMNSYGDAAGTAEDISNSLIMVQNLGVTTVAELAASMGKSISMASAYNVSLGNLESAYVSVTKAGINTAEGTTYISAMMSELGKEGSGVANIIKEETGQSFGELMSSGASLADVLGILYESAGNNAEAMMNLWGSQTAGVAAAAIVNQGLDTFNTNLNLIEDSAGATESAYSIMADTMEFAQQRMTTNAENLKVAIGQNLTPALTKLYDVGANAFGWATSFAQDHPMVVKAATAVAVGLGVAATALVGVTVAAPAAIAAVTSFGVAVNTALGPIGLIAVGITAVVAAGAALIAMLSETEDETAGMTAVTREQYYELQDLNAEYEAACAKYGETSEEASRLKYQVDDLSAAFEANRQTVEEFTAEVDSLCEGVSQVTTDFNSAMTEINGQETGMLALIQKYEDLSAKADKTAADEEALAAVTGKLTESYPELAGQIDATAMSTEDYVSAMKKACEQEAEEQKQQQAQETYIDALAKRAELTEEIAKAQENLNLEQARIDDMSGWDRMWANKDDLEAYQAALDELNAAMEENDATISQIEQGWSDLAAEEEAAAEESVSWEDATTTAYENVAARITELCEAYGEVYNAALESFQGQFGLFDEASTKSEEYVNATVANAQSALDSQLAYWDSYLANVEQLKSVSAEDLGITQANYEALMSYVQDGSAEAAGLAQSMVESINSGDEEAVAALANTVGEVNAKQAEIAAATADWVTDFTSQMNQIEKEMQSTVDGMNLNTEAAAAATATINAYTNSIRAGKAGAVSAAEEVANAVSAAFSAAQAKVNVKVASGGASVAAHAKGTTNAESVFIAGEQGPELVARPAKAYAAGTTDSSDYFIAGENGPELIVGEQGSTVFPTSETDRLISALNNTQEDTQAGPVPDAKPELLQVPQVSVNNGNSDGQTKHIILEVAGSGAIDISGSSGADEATILQILMDNLKPALMGIIRDEIYEEGELSYGY